MAKNRRMDARSEAAKKMRGGGMMPPPEPELPPDIPGEVPPEVGSLPPDVGAAAGGGAGMPPDVAAMMGGGMGAEAGAPPMPTIEEAITSVEAGLVDLPPEKAEEARVHLNAIRDIVSSEGEAGPPAEAGGVPPPEEGSPVPV